jgi:hypothetical protein
MVEIGPSCHRPDRRKLSLERSEHLVDALMDLRRDQPHEALNLGLLARRQTRSL